jgi:hypothetical protein
MLHTYTQVWCVKHLPQNRDVFATGGGNGSVNLYKYCYPAQVPWAEARKLLNTSRKALHTRISLLRHFLYIVIFVLAR